MKDQIRLAADYAIEEAISFESAGVNAETLTVEAIELVLEKEGYLSTLELWRRYRSQKSADKFNTLGLLQ